MRKTDPTLKHMLGNRLKRTLKTVTETNREASHRPMRLKGFIKLFAPEIRPLRVCFHWSVERSLLPFAIFQRPVPNYFANTGIRPRQQCASS